MSSATTASTIISFRFGRRLAFTDLISPTTVTSVPRGTPAIVLVVRPIDVAPRDVVEQVGDRLDPGLAPGPGCDYRRANSLQRRRLR